MPKNMSRSNSLAARALRRIGREITKTYRLVGFRKKGLVFIEPNFLYFPRIVAGSRVIDVGCSYEADFSMIMIGRHGATALAVDPTRKHAEALRKLEEKNKGRFTYLPFAVSKQDGTTTFHESRSNESGSLMPDHVNVLTDETVTYDVQTVSLVSLLAYAGGGEIDILKLDTEGAEFDLLNEVSRDDLRPFKQLFIEFHHHAVAKYSKSDTQRIVNRITEFGYRPYSVDDHNYLFERMD
jgi:FkbM family methyltransferase